MKVLFNLLDAGVGGGQKVALDIAGELVRRGHRVGVVVPEPGPSAERFGEVGAPTHIARLVSLRRPGLAAGARIARAYDLVYSHTSVPGEIIAGAAAALARRPHAVHRHIYPHFSPQPGVRRLQHVLYRRALGHAYIVAVADHVADAVAETGVPRRRIEVIPNGVVIPDEPAPLRGDGVVRVGLLGRLDPQKGADTFVRAAALIGREVELVLGAPAVGGGYAEEVVRAARAANVAVEIPPDPDFLRSLDVVVLPSRYEGHPLVLLEAMARGKPVIASAIPGVREVLEPDRAGILVPPEDAHALAAAVRSLVDNPARRTELGARGRYVVQSRYALSDALDRIVAFLERAAGGAS